MGAVAPAPQQIRQARRDAGLTQAQAAALVHRKARIWQMAEAGDIEIDLAVWELFLIKAGTPPGWCYDCRCPANACAC